MKNWDALVVGGKELEEITSLLVAITKLMAHQKEKWDPRVKGMKEEKSNAPFQALQLLLNLMKWRYWD